MPFTVATYNVLADAYVNPRRYRDVPAAILEPASRRAALLRRIAGLNADLLCLQEVEQVPFDFVLDGLSAAGYRGLWVQKGHGKPDGCATLWRSDPFSVEADHHVFFHDGSRGESESGHVALAVVLCHEGRRLGVLNTHLKWDDPKKTAEQRWCYRQAREVLGWTRGIRPSPESWILCGDLNVSPEDDVLSVLKRGGFVDAFESLDRAHTCLANGRTAKIDHILYTSGLRAQPKAPLTLDGATALPSALEPSDHVPLEAGFVWVG
jgi:mRNA deadenylase 3'-5' endonuclease subunit Ccr4